MKEKNNKVVWLVFGGVLTVAGFIAIPPIIKKLGDKVYKKTLNTKEIDFDDMGPEIVQITDETMENE